MNLLIKTIEEYLSEHHPNWRITPEPYCITATYKLREITRYSPRGIYIRIEKQEIGYHSSTTWDTYTAEALLPKITKMITRIENTT